MVSDQRNNETVPTREQEAATVYPWSAFVLRFGLVAFALCILLFLPILITSDPLWGSGTDIRLMHMPLRHFAFHWLRAGFWPLWNPFVFNGIPFETGVHSLAYPGMVLGLFFPVAWEIKLTFLLHTWLAMVSMGVFLRLFRHSPGACAIGGIAYAMTGFTVSRVFGGHLDILTTSAYLPVVFLFFELAVRFDGLGWTLLAGVALALQIISGHYQIVYLTLFALGTFSFLRVAMGGSIAVLPLRIRQPWSARCAARPEFLGSAFTSPLSPHPASLRERIQDFKWTIVRFIGLGCTAGILASYRLLPALQATGLANRSGERSLTFATSFGVPMVNWLTYLVPDIFGGGRTMPFFAFWSPWEGQGYVGLVVLLLGLFACLTGRSRQWLPFVFVIIGSTALALGRSTPLFGLYYHLDPLIGRFRVPGRFLLPVTFFLSWLGAMGFDLRFTAGLFPKTRVRRAILVFLLGGPILIMTVFAMVAHSDGILVHVTLAFADLRRISGDARDASGLLLKNIRIQWVTALIIVSMGGALLSLDRRLPGARRFAGPALIALLLVDLCLYAWPKMTTRPSSVCSLSQEILETLAKINSGQQRMITLPSLNAVNDGAAFGVSHFGGYDILVDGRYNRAVNMASKYALNRRIMLLSGFDYGPFWQNQGVRYLLSSILLENFPDDFRARFSEFHFLCQTAGVAIYENPSALPRAFVVRRTESLPRDAIYERLATIPGVPRETLFWDTERDGALPEELACVNTVREAAAMDDVTVRSLTPNDVVVDVNLAAPGILVLTDAPFPGWHVSVDSHPAVLYGVNGGLHRALAVPAGAHTVRFTYFPETLKAGLGLTGLGAAGMLLYLVRGWQRRQKRIG